MKISPVRIVPALFVALAVTGCGNTPPPAAEPASTTMTSDPAPTASDATTSTTMEVTTTISVPNGGTATTVVVVDDYPDPEDDGPTTSLANISGDVVDVSIANFMFGPTKVAINIGDTVKWTVNSGTHTTTSDSGLWASGTKSSGEEFSFTFAQAGSYSYFCSIHPSMQATITVGG
jgi:plastocyanin